MHQKQLEQERQKKQAQAVYKQQTVQTFQQQQNAFNQWHHGYAQEIERAQQDELQAVGDMEKRSKALAQHIEGTDGWTEKEYHLSQETINLLGEHSIKTSGYQSCYGVQVQHVLHEEFISILQDTAHLRYEHIADQEAQAFTTTLTLFADAGHLHNHAGFVEKAFSFADFCWNMLDIAKECTQWVGKYVLDDFKFRYEISRAAFRGAWNGANNFKN